VPSVPDQHFRFPWTSTPFQDTTPFQIDAFSPANHRKTRLTEPTRSPGTPRNVSITSAVPDQSFRSATASVARWIIVKLNEVFLGKLSGDTLRPKAKLSIRLPSHFSLCALSPDSVEGDHPSRPGVASRLERCTRSLGGPRRRDLLHLAPDGVWQAAVSPRRWWALTPPFHPYQPEGWRSVFCGTVPRVTPGCR
jgi:hypothetical protein